MEKVSENPIELDMDILGGVKDLLSYLVLWAYEGDRETATLIISLRDGTVNC